MSTKRISDINIQQRGLFTAIFGNVNEDEFFVDDDLKKYSLWQQLYLHLKEQGFETVLFYDTTNNFHSFSQTDLIRFLKLDISSSAGSSATNERYVARHIKSPMRQQRIDAATSQKINSPVEEVPLHQSIQLYKILGTRNNFWRTTVNRNLLDYFTQVLPDATRTAIVIKYPDNSHFENVDQYLTLFKEMNAHRNLLDSDNKILIVYGCNNANALIENLNRNSNHLFVDDYFKTLFLNVEADNYRVKPETTFQILLPEQIEVRNWLNRKRLNKNIHFFNSISIDKIVLRFIQERKKLTDFENYDLQNFIAGISGKSAWDRLGEKIGLDSVKKNIREIVDDIKYLRENDMPMTYRPHLCFMGNPGTGKTTVATIVAEIFKEEGIIPLGHYIQTKATQLVGQHVGDAAKLVNDICERATGGILFIDETHAFITEGLKVYGDAAIKELLTWLENPQWHNQTVVIFAGYPDDIHDLFTKSDPGLKGRFSSDNFVTFSNYNADELLQILNLNAAKNRITISPEAQEMLLKVFEKLLRDNANNKQWDNARRAEDILTMLFRNLRKRKSTTVEVQDIPENLSSLISGKSVTDIRTTKEFIALQNMIGLQSVKQTITDLIEAIEFEQDEIANGIAIEKTIQPLHLVFTGPPGTGKTTVAELFGCILKNLGILSKGHTKKVLRKDLVAGYVGQTAIKTNEAIQEAMGGVLFIDEAYSLTYGGENDFGREAIDTLLPIMESDRDKFVVIAAGYENNMNQFLASNPGLNDRFNQRILFPSYTENELVLVFNLFCKNNERKTDRDYSCVLIQYFALLKNRDGERFSNSRAVRKLFEETNKQQMKRLNSLRRTRELTNAERQTITMDDLHDAMKVLNADLINQIDFNCNSDSSQVSNPIQPVTQKPEIEKPVTVKEPVEIKEETKEPLKPPTELEAAIQQLLYDYCIIDTNIWMETRRTTLYHGRIGTIKKLYSRENKKLVAHGSTYEELTKFASSDIRNEKSNAAYSALRMMKTFHKEKVILIPGLKSTHDVDAYADKDIYDFASDEFQKGKSILFITNDNDCNIRVSSSLEGLKSKNPTLPKFDVLDMEQIAKSVDIIYEKLFKQDRPNNPRR